MHPKYNGSPYCGFDIAVAIRGALIDEKNAENLHDFESNNFLTSIDPDELNNDFEF